MKRTLDQEIELAREILATPKLSKAQAKYLQTIYNRLGGFKLSYCMCNGDEREIVRNLLNNYLNEHHTTQ